MILSTQLRLKELLHSVGFMMLVMVIVASPLVGCGGGGGGSGAIPSGSAGSSATASSSTPPVSSNTAPASSSGTVDNDTVAPVQATGSFNLNWTAPTTRSDGTPLSLSDIDGFRIYYGTSRGNYSNSINVKDGSAQSAVVKDIPVGSYYIVMTTYDVNGLESAYSSAISKTAI